MPRVNYAAPSSVDEAVKVLAGASGLAKVLSGGTDLLVQLRSGRLKPELIVDTKRIPGLIGIREEGDFFIVGAATPGAMLSDHHALEHAWPGIVEGADLIGSTQIQGRASLAGNLCNASPAADSVPAVIAARTTVVIAGPGGKREALAESICTGPGRTSLAKGEFIVEFKIPKPKPHQCDAYLRFIPRTEMDIAVVGCGVNVTLDAETISYQTYQLTDGSVWMLPIYNYSGVVNNADGSSYTGTWSTIAVDPTYIQVSTSSSGGINPGGPMLY